MSSGLIYFAVIALWVAYFLPRWLRSHDEVSESKSLERYRGAMHVVAMGTSQNTYMTRAEIAEREARMLRKRQLTLIALSAFLISIFIFALANVLPFKSLLLPVSLLVIFIVHVRRQKVQEDVKKRRRMAASQGKGSTYNFSEITYRAPEGEASTWIPIDHSRTVTIIRNDSWKPSDMPLPTYMSAPKAPARPLSNKPAAPFDQEETIVQGKVQGNEEEKAPQSEEVFDQEQDRRAANE
jgi:membrane protein implicated in regulation of membrane protease activity